MPRVTIFPSASITMIVGQLRTFQLSKSLPLTPLGPQLVNKPAPKPVAEAAKAFGDRCLLWVMQINRLECYRLRNSGSRPKDSSNPSRPCTDGSLRCYRAKQNPSCDHGIWLSVLIVSDMIGKFPCERDRRSHAH